LNEYKRIVVCSENIKAHLYAHGAEITKVSLVPVIQEQISINQVLANDLLAKYRIHRPYIFYGGLVKESKGVDLLLEAFLKHIRPTRNISLVISGLLKSSQHKLRSMLNEEGVQYIGNQSRQNVLALIDNAALCVNLSSAEGLPRASLEAIALKRPTVLPPNIPEFENHCTDNIAHQLDAPSAASKMLQILDSKVSPPYPIEIHYPENVVEQYLEILKS
jgi:glycosyltransferase involved in cell wall biosynthesis